MQGCRLIKLSISALLLPLGLFQQEHPATNRRQADAFLTEEKYEAAVDAFLKTAGGSSKREDPGALKPQSFGRFSITSRSSASTRRVASDSVRTRRYCTLVLWTQ